MEKTNSGSLIKYSRKVQLRLVEIGLFLSSSIPNDDCSNLILFSPDSRHYRTTLYHFCKTLNRKKTVRDAVSE